MARASAGSGLLSAVGSTPLGVGVVLAAPV